MLNIYSGRESVDKEKFIYERIGENGGETFVIVPNQYTLVAEQQALKYLNGACLYNVEIISMNRLGRRLLIEKGLENTPTLDKYGRFMLLSMLIRDCRDELDIFKTSAGKRTFVEMVNDFISDLKQQDCTVSDLEALLESGGANELLRKKLAELKLICDEYERRIEGKYTDSEDLIAMYIGAVETSELVAGKEIWVYGYDSVTPKFRNAVTELARRAQSVNFVVNENDFGLDRTLVAALSDECRDKGIEFTSSAVPDSYEIEKAGVIRRIERELFARTAGASGAAAAAGCEDLSAARTQSAISAVTIVECANPYYEAESAAAYIYRLIRDEGYRMRDIAVVANDEEGMHPKVKRTFEEFGLPLFVDSSRPVGDSQAASLIVSLLQLVSKGYRTSDMMLLLKSGLSGYADGIVDELENYARGYKIKGSMWSRPFKYGASDYDEATFAALEELRSDIMHRIAPLAELAGAVRTNKDGTVEPAATMAEFAEGFCGYLNDVWQLGERIQAAADECSASGGGAEEEARRIGQSYEALMNILVQISEVCGDEKMNLDEFIGLYVEGIEGVEVGILPPYADGIAMGTMIRTRPAPVKAMLVLGANEGILPMEPSPEGLFSVDEKAYFAGREFPLGELDDIKMLEESAAMYRMMSKPGERIYISYSLSDGGKDDMKPSVLVDSLRELFPELRVEKDIVSRGFGWDLINSRRETLRHLMNHLKARPAEAAPGDFENAAPQELLAHAVMSWYERNEQELLAPMVRAGLHDNAADPLPPELARRLYAAGGDYRLSASELERFDHCPFRHFVLYGLRPHEEREYTGDARAIGDLYHECIMRVSRRLIREEDGRRAVLDISEDEIARIVDEELSSISENYRGGLFVSTGRERYRLERIASVCRDAVAVLTAQLRNGELSDAYFEEQFGRGCRFAPIVYEFDGSKVYIEGKIDRVDVMSGGEVRIIDYKTGSDTLDIERMRCGYKMQLMVYLESATSGELSPAGMFYFNIGDMDMHINDADMGSEEKRAGALSRKSAGRFTLKGALIDEEEIYDKMPPQVLDKSLIRLPRREFEQLAADVRESIERISGGVVSGVISIEPARQRDRRSECLYCEYKPICRFDLSYRGNRYRSVK